MDELKNKEFGEEESVASETKAEETNDSASPDALLKELEDIRDMFQEAIDNAAQDEPVDGEIIQELDDYNESEDGAADEESDLPLCDCCGEAHVSTLYGEDYPYCDNCRELMKHYPLRISGILTMIVMFLVLGFSAYLSADSLEGALVVMEARSAAAQNKMMSTVQSIHSFTTSQKTDSQKAIDLLIDGFLRTGYISNAKETIERYYTAEELNRAGNKRYKEIVDFVDNFLETRENVQDIVSDAFSGKDFDCDELIAELEKEKEAFLDTEKGIKQNAPLIEYYKYELLRLSNADLEKQLEILRAIEEADETGLADWIYLPSICEVAAKMGNKKLAEEYFEKMLEVNAEDMKAYTTFALYYRYLETPDADAIIELCDEAAKNAYEGDTSYYPTLVIAYLLKGEGSLAFETMATYMSSNYYTVSNCNLYALCGLYIGDTQTYEDMKTTLEESGFEMSSIVKKYKKGKISLNEVLADMRGDIG